MQKQNTTGNRLSLSSLSGLQSTGRPCLQTDWPWLQASPTHIHSRSFLLIYPPHSSVPCYLSTRHTVLPLAFLTYSRPISTLRQIMNVWDPSMLCSFCSGACVYSSLILSLISPFTPLLYCHCQVGLRPWRGCKLVTSLPDAPAPTVIRYPSGTCSKANILLVYYRRMLKCM